MSGHTTWYEVTRYCQKPMPIEVVSSTDKTVTKSNGRRQKIWTDYSKLYPSEAEAIAAIKQRNDRENERRRDARVRDAAPNLLAACIAILKHSHIADSDPADWEPEDHAAESAVRAAIAKALGDPA